MKQFTLTVQDENGIHARPAGALVACAKKFVSDIRIATADREADGKRLLSVMSLGATRGTRITCTADGPDEDAAIGAMETCCKETLGHG